MKAEVSLVGHLVTLEMCTQILALLQSLLKSTLRH